VTARELVAELDLRERLAAIADELELLDDRDVPATLLEALREDLDVLLAEPEAES
jgi:hypothetical protein